MKIIIPVALGILFGLGVGLIVVLQSFANTYNLKTLDDIRTEHLRIIYSICDHGGKIVGETVVCNKTATTKLELL